MVANYNAALSNAIAELQRWYGADSYAADKGLYHYDSPELPWYAPPLQLGENIADMLTWWNSANAIAALANYMIVTGDRSYIGVIEKTFIAAQTAWKPSFTGLAGTIVRQTAAVDLLAAAVAVQASTRASAPTA